MKSFQSELKKHLDYIDECLWDVGLAIQQIGKRCRKIEDTLDEPPKEPTGTSS